MEGLDLRMRSDIKESFGSWKLEKCRQCCGGGDEGRGCEPECECWWMLEILSLKNCIRELQMSAEYRWGGRESRGWRIL